MTVVVDGAGTSQPLTPATAASLFEEVFSDAEEAVGTEDSATPPAQESPEPESEDPESGTEQLEGEDNESPEGEQPEDGNEAEPEQPETFTVTVDGEELQVTRDELLKGYSRQADYSRKTMKLAEERKAFEAETQSVVQERAKYAEALKTLETTISQYTPQEPDWRSLQATMEPGEFAREYAMWQQHNAEMTALRAERERAEQAVREDQEKALAAHFREQHRLLLEAKPEWKDPEKLKTARSQMEAAAESVGFSKEDINGVTDYRLILLLEKAALYDAAQKKRPAIEQHLANKVRTAAPGARGTVQGQKKQTPAQLAQKRLAKTGSIRDAAAVMMEMDD